MTRLDAISDERLYSIRGAPPSLISPPSGCRFRPRCDFAQEVCSKDTPVPVEHEEGHSVACHFAPDLDLSGVKMEDEEAVG